MTDELPQTTALPQTSASPIPGHDERTAPYWNALLQNTLLLRRCRVCSTVDHPIAVLCRTCDSPDLEWFESCTCGTLFSWTVESRSVVAGMAVPYVIAQVTPDGVEEGGVRMVGTLLTDRPTLLRIGQPVRIRGAAVPGSPRAILVFEV